MDPSSTRIARTRTRIPAMRLSTTRPWLPIAFLIVNAYGVYCLHDLRRQPTEPQPTVFFDAGHDSRVSGREQLAWHFSTAVAPAGAIGEWTRHGPLDITPRVPGRFGWTDERTLLFRPEVDWPNCTAFTAIPCKPGAADFGNAAPFHFETAALQLLEVTHVGHTPSGVPRLRLDFNAAPDLISLKETLTIRTRNNKVLSWRIERDGGRASLQITTGSVDAEALKLELAAGLAPRRGQLGLAATLTRQVKLDASLRVQSINANCSGFDPPFIHAHFNSHVEPEALRDFISIEPPLELRVTRRHSWYNSRCRLDADFEPGRRYRITFRAGLPGQGARRLARTVTRSVRIPNRTPNLSFRAPGRYLSASGALSLRMTSVNVLRVNVSAERLYTNNLSFYALREAGLLKGDRAEWYGSAHDRLTRHTGQASIDTRGVADRTSDTTVNLRPLLDDAPAGAYLVRATSPGAASTDKLVIVSDLGLTLKLTRHEAWVRVAHLLTARPLADAHVCIYSDRNQLIAEGTSGADGLARLPIKPAKDQNVLLVTATHGRDTTYLALDGSRTPVPGESDGVPHAHSPLQVHCFADRGAYRPGETAHVRAIVRTPDLGVPAPFPLELRILKPDGRELRRTTLMLNALGTVTADVPWPHDTPTGRYRLNILTPGSEAPLAAASVLVDEFAPPRIAVDALPGDSLDAEKVRFDIAARHLFGRPAQGLRCQARVTFASVPFKPEQWPDHHFSDERLQAVRHEQRFGNYFLDAEGHLTLFADRPPELSPPSALKARLLASVIETSGRGVSAQAEQLCHVYPRYVGLRSRQGRDVITPGVPHRVDVVVLTPDGNKAGDLPPDLTVEILEESWQTVLKEENGHYRYRSEHILDPIKETTLPLSGAQAEYTFVPPRAGCFVVAVSDAEGGMTSTLRFTAIGEHDSWTDRSRSQPDRIELELDRQTYAPGDVPELLIKSPFAGEALLTLEADSILAARTFSMTGNTQRVSIALPADAPSSLHAVVQIVRPLPRDTILPVCRAVGSIGVDVIRPARRLQLTISAPETTRPDAPTPVEIRVCSADGLPQAAEVCLAAVDEGICRLTGYETPDTLAYYRRRKRLGVALYDLYSRLLPELGKRVDENTSHIGGGGPGGRLSPVTSSRFRPVALWHGPYTTDSNGIARVTLDVPEFAGTLRLMATAVSSNALGNARHDMIVSRPLLATPALPRFMAPGDSCSVSLTLFNQTDAPVKAQCLAEATPPLSIEWQRERIQLAAGAQTRLTGILSAGQTVGVGDVNFRISANDESYVIPTQMPVRPPIGVRSLGGVGDLGPGESVRITPPAAWTKGTGRLTVTCAGNPAVQLGQPLHELLRYPYGCLEQTTSRCFPLLYLDALLDEEDLAEATPTADSGFIEAGIERILSMQRYDGLFDYWPRSGQRYSWGSVYATHFLVEAQRAGYDVPKAELDAALEALQRGLVQRDENNDGADLNRAIYATTVLSLASRPPRGWLQRYVELESELSLSARVNLALALAAAGQRRAARDIARSIPIPQLRELPRERDGALVSPVRETALLLYAWQEIDTEAPAVQQLARALIGSMRHGRWGSTQENAMALMALGRYARSFAHTPVAGTLTIRNDGEHAATNHVIAADDAWTHNGALSGKATLLTLTNTADTPCFYQWTARGVPTTWTHAPVRQGLSIERIWHDDSGNVITPGTPLRQGALIRAVIRISPLGQQLDNLVVEDLLPAGCEIENPNLKTSALLTGSAGEHRLPVRHVDRRDDRLLLFPARIDRTGVFAYTLRAVTPGTFILPPIAAECMYDDAIRAEGPSSRIVVLRRGEQP